VAWVVTVEGKNVTGRGLYGSVGFCILTEGDGENIRAKGFGLCTLRLSTWVTYQKMHTSAYFWFMIFQGVVGP
jgi:hypothetical protein